MADNSATISFSVRRNILVTGATGKQGTALVKALIHSTTPDTEPQYHIFALTRKASSPNAALLQSHEQVTLVEGDLDNPTSISKIFEEAKVKGGIWGVFAVLAYPGLGANADGEERQGKMIADLALQHGVKAFVYSSAARSGPKYEAGLTLSGAAKREVEDHCKLLGEKGLDWTYVSITWQQEVTNLCLSLLRPGFFMENFDNFIGSIGVSVLKAGLRKETEIGLIAADDIGSVAAGVFKNPEKYRFKTLVAIGDFQTMGQLEDSYTRATGRSIPSVPYAMAWFITTINKSTQDLIDDIELNYHARNTGEYPELEGEIRLANEAFTMRSYYEWVKDGKRDTVVQEGWNNLSIGKLLTGRL